MLDSTHLVYGSKQPADPLTVYTVPNGERTAERVVAHAASSAQRIVSGWDLSIEVRPCGSLWAAQCVHQRKTTGWVLPDEVVQITGEPDGSHLVLAA